MSRDPSSVREVQTYVPRLLSAVDALGRLLFLARINSSMREAYGDHRINLMEKSLKQVFSELWDLVLGLQQGQVDETSDLIGGALAQTIGQ